MMAVVAELSMRQAECMTLQQEMKEKELQLDMCQKRVEQGLPPSDNIENEWLRYLRDQHRRQADAEKKARVSLQMPSHYRHKWLKSYSKCFHEICPHMNFSVMIGLCKFTLYRYKGNSVSTDVSVSDKPSNDSWITLKLKYLGKYLNHRASNIMFVWYGCFSCLCLLDGWGRRVEPASKWCLHHGWASTQCLHPHWRSFASAKTLWSPGPL